MITMKTSRVFKIEDVERDEAVQVQVQQGSIKIDWFAYSCIVASNTAELLSEINGREYRVVVEWTGREEDW